MKLFLIPLFYLDPGSGSLIIQIIVASILESALLPGSSGQELKEYSQVPNLTRRNRSNSLMTMPETGRTGSSFRDPSGFIFIREGRLYRQVNEVYAEKYNLLMSSGLYQDLTREGLLVTHAEVDVPPHQPGTAYKVIAPEPLPFISYPYEWCFSQLKDAALLTLSIAQQALAHGMVLKDASAYNVQFRDGKPVFIDTLSFDVYHEGQPWEAYRQFCQHFLAPLALAAHVNVRLIQLLRTHIDGLPLDLTSRLLPSNSVRPVRSGNQHTRSCQNAGALFRQPAPQTSRRKISQQQLTLILQSLENSVRRLNWTPAGTEWGEYYQATNYSDEAMQRKVEQVEKLILRAAPAFAWDLGANTGLFSRIASEKGIFTVSSDIDPAAVEKNYLQMKQHNDKNLLPLLIDLTNPSPALGWANQERDSYIDRGPVDLVIALALIHHLAISNNVPLPLVAQFFASIGRWALVEFVPKADSQVQRLLASRKDIFDTYNEAGFETAFQDCFELVEKVPLSGTQRNSLPL